MLNLTEQAQRAELDLASAQRFAKQFITFPFQAGKLVHARGEKAITRAVPRRHRSHFSLLRAAPGQ